MAKIIQKRKVEWIEHWERKFERSDGSGYGFECDKNGFLLEPERWAVPMAECLKDPTLCDYGIVSYERKKVSHTKILCGCGRVIELWDPVTNQCECHRWYNGGGQELNPPRMWGEETGERFDDNGNYIGGGYDD